MLTFLEDGTGDGVTWTYGDLDREARRVAGRLRGTVVRGEPVLLMAAPGLDYVAGFYGCMYAGVVAVPAYPPSPFHGRDNMDRLQAVATNAGMTIGLTTDSLLPSVDGFSVGGEPIEWVSIDSETAELDEVEIAHAAAGDVAFLQYTSGSTGDPKGVMVTQGNLLANAHMIGQGYHLEAEMVGVTWLPPYHDMGLIGTLLTAPLLGVRIIFMPPGVFLRRPARWLQVISRFGAQVTAGPNFAYQSCVDKVKEADLAELDLSSWRVAINGAEPIRVSTIERFVERFSPYGFRETAFRPSYGLAETTLLATAGSAQGPRIFTVDRAALLDGALRQLTSPGESQRLVSSGRPPEGAQVRVVDEATQADLRDGQVGEIVVTGPHVVRGYWRRPEATAEHFKDDAVRTGDLGAILDGELVVIGRSKDVMIIRGRNYHPQDIELTVEEADGTLRRGSGAAFTVDRDDLGLLVVVQEVNPALVDEPGDLVAKIRHAVTVAHGISPAAVVLTRPGTVPKTSSGKVRRGDARRLWEEDALEPFWSWRSGALLDPQDVGAD